MRSLRRDYDINYAKSLYLARKSGKLIDEIAFNKALNPRGLTPRRISAIINNYEDQLSLGRVTHEE